ncbi:MAG: ABC transporter ATP-binding protein [Rhodoferax sp.]|nr:ABC transporter ATP-binding protein [Rhodoferax sp.]
MIEFLDVSKAYDGVLAIDSLSLLIREGEFLVLIGPSGSGKSTALKLINRMLDHDQGRILFDKQEIYSFDVRDLRRRMGYAIQSVGLFPHWSVARNIGTVPHLLGWSPARIDRRVDELLALFDMDPAVFRGRMPHELSGGQQQRVGVARALAADPPVLLMDEPFGALDPVTRSALQLELKRIHQTFGKTIVMVTHDIDEALLLANRIVLLRQGRVEQVATPLELLSNPASDFVLDFVGRTDLGVKRLSLLPLAPYVKPGAQLAGAPNIPANANLREAVATMAAHSAATLNVQDARGQFVGCLQATDVFQGDHRA